MNISKINCNETLYEIKDEQARNEIETFKQTFINVLDYGLESETDCTSTFNTLIKTYPNHTLYFPKGTYYFSQSIDANSIYLDNATLQWQSQSDYAINITQFINGKGVIDCNYKATNGITVSDNTSITNITIKNASGIGINLQGSKNFIRNIILYNCTNAIYSAGGNQIDHIYAKLEDMTDSCFYKNTEGDLLSNISINSYLTGLYLQGNNTSITNLEWDVDLDVFVWESMNPVVIKVSDDVVFSLFGARINANAKEAFLEGTPGKHITTGIMITGSYCTDATDSILNSSSSDEDSTSNLIYSATSLEYDGTNYDTIDFQPFLENAPNFEMTMLFRFNPTANEALATFFNSHTYTDSTLYGLTIGVRDSNNSIAIMLDETTTYLSVSEETSFLITWTKIGNISYIVYSYNKNHGVISQTHQLNFGDKIHIGASEKEDGTIWRYAIGNIDYIKIKRI